MDQSFYLTTPIYYVNARPHIGTTYTTVVADVIARRRRMLGDDVRFLTGTDEHGQKIERSAARAGISPQQFTDQVSAHFKELWQRMGLTHDDFLRTTEERHKRGVVKLWNTLKERGFLYKATYTGQYCVSDETFVDVAPGMPCPDCGRMTETVSEDNYFFKLSAFEEKLLRFYDEHPEFIQPETRRNEVLAFVRGGLRDLSVSRASFKWGIPVPDDPEHVIYVWLDALANYITALGYGSEDESLLKRYWPAQLHIIGKEISRFHCVYWPAFLMAAGLPLPKTVVAHGWLLFEESKMSKSRGNIVRAETILEVLGADALRYFLLREIIFGQDGNFSFDALVTRYNADLANGYGNLVSRTLAMIQQNFPRREVLGTPHESIIPEASSTSPELQQAADALVNEIEQLFIRLDLSRSVERIREFAAMVDAYLTQQEPWKLAAAAKAEGGNAEAWAKLGDVLYTAAESIRIITALIYPIIPEATAKVWAQLGLGDIAKADLRNLSWGGLQPGTRLGTLGPVFPRADKSAIERMQAMEQNRDPQPAAPAETIPATAADVDAPLDATIMGGPVAPPLVIATETSAAVASAIPLASFEPGLMNMEDAALAGMITQPAPVAVEVTETGTPRPEPAPQITIDDFMKVELRVAQILVAERVPKADKLLRLEVDLGYERRQILAGIAETYAPETLIGRKIVIVANLAPRKLRGLESNGMLLAASLGEQGKPSLAGFLDAVELGARLK